MNCSNSYDEYRKSVQVFKGLVWLLVVFHKLFLIWAQFILIIPG